MTQETEREKFEAWCVKRNPNATGLFERHGKIYLREAVRAAWEAWQAALEANQEDHIGDATNMVQMPEPVAFIDATRQECRMAGCWMVAGDWDGLYTEQQVRALLATTAAPVDEMAMLVRKLVQQLRKAAPGNESAEKALDYLKRKGLQGNPLRNEDLQS